MGLAFQAMASVSLSFLFPQAPSFADLTPFCSVSSVQYNKPTFLDNLMTANRLTKNIFGVHLNRGSQLGSSLTLGAIDTTKYTGALTEFAVETQTYWDIRASGYYVGDKVGFSLGRNWTSPS